MRALLAALMLSGLMLQAQKADPLEGLWQGYDGEWGHVSRQLVALAEVIPPDKYSWRPAPGVRSVSEVFMHIALANFFLLSETGDSTMPSEIKSAQMEKTVTSKPEVISWLKRSQDAVKNAHASAKPADLRKNVDIEGRHSTVDGVYLRILVHANEHMGQLVAYARMNGITPPWSKKTGE
jgi:uncharacterized damage-inducible protein DinB